MRKQKGEPFTGIDQSWQTVQTGDSSVLKYEFLYAKSIDDVNFTHSFNSPNDNTVVGFNSISAETMKCNFRRCILRWFQLSKCKSEDYDTVWYTEYCCSRNDYSPYRGQYQLANVYRYLSEAYVGYHINKWYGINIDAGMFVCPILVWTPIINLENWEYQASFTSDNTPWFFNDNTNSFIPPNT